MDEIQEILNTKAEDVCNPEALQSLKNKILLLLLDIRAFGHKHSPEECEQNQSK